MSAPTAPVALVDDRVGEAQGIAARLRRAGLSVERFADGDLFLTSPHAYEHSAFVLGEGVPGVATLHLLRLIRRRSEAPVILLADPAPSSRGIDAALAAGADMVLQRPTAPSTVEAGLAAIRRRIAGTGVGWNLDASRRCIRAPNGIEVGLNNTELALLAAFADARGAAVGRDDLSTLLRHDAEELANADGALHAAMYRLRRRLETATGMVVPLKAQPRKGYAFRAELQWG